MARCEQLQGRDHDLVWDVKLLCDNPECAYHKPMYERGWEWLTPHPAAV